MVSQPNSTPVEYVLLEKGCRFLGFPEAKPWGAQMPHGAVIHSAPAIRAYTDAKQIKAGGLALHSRAALTGGAFTSSLIFIEETAAERGLLEKIGRAHV